MENSSPEDETALLGPVQGHLIEIVSIVNGLGPIYRPNLGFPDPSIRNEAAVATLPGEP